MLNFIIKLILRILMLAAVLLCLFVFAWFVIMFLYAIGEVPNI